MNKLLNLLTKKGDNAFLTEIRRKLGASNSNEIVTDPIVLAMQAVGSTIKYQSVGTNLVLGANSTALVNGNVRWVAVYVTKQTSITGIGFYQKVQGVFTGSADNKLALYSLSSGTLTQVASTANDENIWKNAANTYVRVPFSTGVYAAKPGLYYVAFTYNNSAQTTAPSLIFGTNVNSVNVNAEALLFGSINGTTLPSSVALTSVGGSANVPWVFLY